MLWNNQLIIEQELEFGRSLAKRKEKRNHNSNIFSRNNNTHSLTNLLTFSKRGKTILNKKKLNISKIWEIKIVINEFKMHSMIWEPWLDLIATAGSRMAYSLHRLYQRTRTSINRITHHLEKIESSKDEKFLQLFHQYFQIQKKEVNSNCN
jgi:hypothetical protein